MKLHFSELGRLLQLDRHITKNIMTITELELSQEKEKTLIDIFSIKILNIQIL